MSAAVHAQDPAEAAPPSRPLQHVCSFCGAIDVESPDAKESIPMALRSCVSVPETATRATPTAGMKRPPSFGASSKTNPFSGLATRATSGKPLTPSSSVSAPLGFGSVAQLPGAAHDDTNFPGSASGLAVPTSTSDAVAPQDPPVPSRPPGSGIRGAIYAAVKNFGIGVGLKVAVALLQHLISGRAPKSVGSILNTQSLRFGLFLGGFAGTYKGLLALIQNVLPSEKGHLPSFVAGAVAAASIFFLKPGDRPSIAVYLFVRSMAILAHGARHQAWYPKSLKSFQHGDTALMCLSACHILFAYIYEQDTLPPSYLKFLLMAGRKTKPTIDAVAFTGRKLPINTTAVDADRAARGLQAVDWARYLNPKTGTVLSQSQPTCEVLHPGQNCVSHYATFTFKHFFQVALRFYLPLNLTSIIIFRGRSVLQDPNSALAGLLRSCVRSAAFLSVYCANAWGMCCLLRRMGVLSGLSTWLFVGPMAGLAVLLESKARRLELAIYCMSPALQSFYKCVRKWGWLPKIHYVDYMFFALAMGVIMSAMQNNPKHMLTNYPSLSKIMKSMIGIEM